MYMTVFCVLDNLWDRKLIIIY